MNDPRAVGDFKSLVEWFEFAATYALDFHAPSDVAYALRQVAVAVDQFPDECWYHDYMTNTDYIGPMRTVRDDA